MIEIETRVTTFVVPFVDYPFINVRLQQRISLRFCFAYARMPSDKHGACQLNYLRFTVANRVI